MIKCADILSARVEVHMTTFAHDINKAKKVFRCRQLPEEKPAVLLL